LVIGIISVAQAAVALYNHTTPDPVSK
jgi:hypothetical protein